MINNTQKLKLPKGIQTFEKLRNEGCVYVDKTKYFVDLIDKGSIYFLSRPRRFGKSLTISTFEALFSGKKDLFKGLYAEAFFNRSDFQPSPVIRLDMSLVNTSEGIDGIKESILYLTNETARKLKVELSDTKLYGVLLNELITRTSEKYNRKVVVLIDEYDKPYTDFVSDAEMANKVRNVLRDFYVQIKASDEFVRFIFLTGISKFTRFSVFSTLNNLDDISMMPEYAGICGYTEEEIIRYFPDYMKETACEMDISIEELLEQMRQYYDGFSFDYKVSTRLYNPFSILMFFDKKKFSNFWFQTGGSKLIAEYMKEKHLTVEQFRNFPTTFNFIETPGDMDTTEPHGFLFQSGYLTLRKGTDNVLSLDYPNTEVLNSMSELVAQNIFQTKGGNYFSYSQRIFTAIQTDNYKLFTDTLNVFLASIPYDDFSKAAEQVVIVQGYKFPAQEWLYRSNILSFLTGCGIVVAAEMHTNKGRPDLVISWKGKIWVIEIKVAYKGQSAENKAKEALRQITENNYAKPFPDAVCLGIGIENEARQITFFLLTDNPI